MNFRSKGILKKQFNMQNSKEATQVKKIKFNEETEVYEEIVSKSDEDEVVPDSLDELDKETEKETMLEKAKDSQKIQFKKSKAKLCTTPKRTIKRKRAPYVLLKGNEEYHAAAKKPKKETSSLKVEKPIIIKKSEVESSFDAYPDSLEIPIPSSSNDPLSLDEIDATFDSYMKQIYAKKGRKYIPPDQSDSDE